MFCTVCNENTKSTTLYVFALLGARQWRCIGTHSIPDFTHSSLSFSSPVTEVCHTDWLQAPDSVSHLRLKQSYLWRVKIERVLNQNRKWGYLSNDFKCKLFLFPVGLTLHGGNTQTSHLKGQHRPGLLVVMKLKNKIHFSASLRHKQSGKKQKKTN